MTLTKPTRVNPGDCRMVALILPRNAFLKGQARENMRAFQTKAQKRSEENPNTDIVIPTRRQQPEVDIVSSDRLGVSPLSKTTSHCCEQPLTSVTSSQVVRNYHCTLER